MTDFAIIDTKAETENKLQQQPQGYAAPPPQAQQQAPQNYTAPPQGYAAPPQQQPPQGYAAPPWGDNQAPAATSYANAPY